MTVQGGPTHGVKGRRRRRRSAAGQPRRRPRLPLGPLGLLLPLLAAAAPAAVGAPDSAPPTPRSAFRVEACAGLPDGVLSGARRAGLEAAGFAKCTVAAMAAPLFGRPTRRFLLVGTAAYPDAHLLTAANALAELLDQDRDGVADCNLISAGLALPKGPILVGGASDEGEEVRLADELGFAAAFGLETPKAGAGPETAQATLAEQVIRMVTTYGYAAGYPKQFDVMDFTSSVACREMSNQSCVTWQHPDNVCPNPGTHTPPPLEGACTQAECDCATWHGQVAFILAGQAPVWTGLTTRTKAELEAVLSAEFLAVMRNPAYHQLRRPLTYEYDVSAGGGPGEAKAKEAAKDSGALGTTRPALLLLAAVLAVMLS